MTQAAVWPEDRSEKLRVLWDKGSSASEIARELGVTRNSVIGKVRRLELSYRREPMRPQPRHTHTIENWVHKTCSYPVDLPGDQGFHFCGLEVIDNAKNKPSPYCQDHYSLCYIPKRKRQ